MASLHNALLLASVSLVSGHIHGCADAHTECTVADENSLLQTGIDKNTIFTDSSRSILHRTEHKDQRLHDEAFALEVKEELELHKAAHAGAVGIMKIAVKRNTCMMDQGTNCQYCPLMLSDPRVLGGSMGFNVGERGFRMSQGGAGRQNGRYIADIVINIAEVPGFRSDIGDLRIRYMVDENRRRDKGSYIRFSVLTRGQGPKSKMFIYNDAEAGSCVRPAKCTVDLMMHPDAWALVISTFSRNAATGDSLEVTDMSLRYGNCPSTAGGITPDIDITPAH